MSLSESLSDDQLVPTRTWDELITASALRGRRLRRRRHVALAVPLVVVVMGAAALPLSAALRHPTSSDSLVTTPAGPHDLPVPTTSGPTSAPRLPTGAVGAAQVRTPRLEPEPDPARGAGAPAAAGRGVSHRADRDAKTLAPASARIRSPHVVRFDDARGDAEPTRGVSGGVGSEPSHDVLRMEFTAEPDGVRMRMQLAVDRDPRASYFARMTTDDGCEIVMWLGPTKDAYNVRCVAVGPASDYVYVQTVHDRSARDLEAFLPYADFPPQVRPEADMAIVKGETRLPVPGGGTRLVDEATTAERLPGRPS